MGALVSVGVPVFNGAGTVGRALASVVAQTTRDLEIVVSDNASTDDTAAICRDFAGRDPRVRYVRQPQTTSVAANYEAVKQLATGEYFMWLGSDDWLDPAYVERCREVLDAHHDVALAVGRSCHYDGAELRFTQRVTPIEQDDPRARVLAYLRTLESNTYFYGLMRRHDIARLAMKPGIASDYAIVAGLAFLGKLVAVDDVAIHRRLGGMSNDQTRIARNNNLPAWRGRFHMFTVPAELFRDIAWSHDVFRAQPTASRYALAAAVAAMMASRRTKQTFGRSEGVLGRMFPSLRRVR